MRIGALIFGLLGGLAGIVGGVLVSGIGGVRAVLPNVSGLGLVGAGVILIGIGVASFPRRSRSSRTA